MSKKPRLSFWQIWNMSFGFLGIQFGFALQNGNMSRIFETLGVDMATIPILWVAAPVTGLIVQPIIGYMSDRTWSPKWGRRRPFFFIGAVLASISLFIMPNSPEMWFAAGMLWILDASINISMEPFRAFVGDNLPSEQRTSGFAMQSFFIGVGAVVASCLPWMLTNWFNVSNTAPEGVIPDSVKWSFYSGGVVFFLAVLWTVLKSKEYSPEELEAHSEDSEAETFTFELGSADAYAKNGTRQMITGLIVLLAGVGLTYLFYSEGMKQDLYILSVGIAAFGVFWIISGLLQKSGSYKNGYVTIINDCENMPATMKQLAVVQFFSWFALFAMWIYTTSAVTSHVYGTSDTTSTLYNDGADWVSLNFGIYNGVAALAAFLLPLLAKATSRKMTHMIALCCGGVGLASIYLLKDPDMLIIPMIGVGIAWASILSMPYAILTGSLPASKMGYFMGVFNFFIVIPQIVAASILGFLLTDVFNAGPIYALIIGGVSMCLAGVLCLFIKDVDDVKS